MLQMPYEQQLKKKEDYIRHLLKGICPVKPISGMEEPFHYRNKVHGVVGRGPKGTVMTGTYQSGSHRLVNVDRCLIDDPRGDEIILAVRRLAQSFKLIPYNEDTGYGLLRHVLVRVARATGQIMVVLVTASPIFPSRNNFVRALRREFPAITTIVQNINDRQTSMVLGEREQVLYGQGYIEDILCGLKFRISAGSFYQINAVQTEKLYREAVRLAGLTGRETVVDAYCGIGTISLIAAKEAGHVIGVELNRDAVRDAVGNARSNKITNARFYAGDAGEFLTRMAAEGQKADVIFMDPPRSGSTETFIRAVAEMGPARVVYISCGPETLARDLKLFGRMGYAAEYARPFDMFCQTGHVETVCLMSRVEGK